PLVAPLHGGVSVLEFLGYLNQDNNAQNLVAARDTTFGYELVKAQWQSKVQAADFATNWWPKALHAGLVDGFQLASENVALNAAAIATAVQNHAKASGIEVVLRGCAKM